MSAEDPHGKGFVDPSELTPSAGKSFNLGRVYFFFLAAVLLPQVLGVSNKGSLSDTAWKFAVLAVFLYVMLRRFPRLSLRGAILMSGYGAAQALCLLLLPVQVPAHTVLSNSLTVLAMAYACLYIPRIHTPREPAEITWFVDAYIALMLVACVYNFAINRSLLLNIGSLTNAYLVDVSSFFDNKNTFGAFLFMGVAAAVLRFRMRPRLVYALATSVFLASLVTSFSRTALFSVGVFAVVLLLAQPKGRLRAAIAMGGAVAGSAVVVATSPTVSRFLYALIIRDDAAIISRAAIWESALQLLRGGRLLLGYGEGASPYLLATRASSQYTHNAILTLLFDGGIIKLALWLVLLMFLTGRIRRVYRIDPNMGAWFIAINVAGLGYSMFESVTWLDASATSLTYTLLSLTIPLLYFNMMRAETVGLGPARLP